MSNVCTVCNKPGWPDCGHLDGMPDAPVPEGDADAQALAEYEMEYRRRGRPKLAPDQKRREKLSVSFTEQELKDIMIAAANDPTGPKRPQDWARNILIEASKPKEGK